MHPSASWRDEPGGGRAQCIGVEATFTDANMGNLHLEASMMRGASFVNADLSFAMFGPLNDLQAPRSRRDRVGAV